MYFKRKLLIGLLAAGTIGGYAAGFASVRHHMRRHCERREHEFQRKVASACAEAVEENRHQHHGHHHDHDDHDD